MSKKKVMHLLSSNSFAGAENVACTIIENDNKYDMYYCCPKGPIEDVLKERKIKYIPLKKLRPWYIKRACNKNGIDILHAHDYQASFWAVISNFKGNVISQLHVNWDFNSSWNLYTFIYKVIMKRFSKVIVVSKEIVDNAVYAKNNMDKFEVITNVVDKKRVLRMSNSFESSFYDLIFVGRLVEVKRPDFVIEITKKLREKIPNIRTCIIGNGELENKCKSLIKEYQLENNIDMLGFLPNPFPYIKNSKIALLPSLHEGLPMSAIECMILGVPVLNSGVDGLSTMFKNYPDFICSNINDYCSMIEKIMNNKIDLSRMCDEIIEDAVDMKNYIKKINALYEEME